MATRGLVRKEGRSVDRPSSIYDGRFRLFLHIHVPQDSTRERSRHGSDREVPSQAFADGQRHGARARWVACAAYNAGTSSVGNHPCEDLLGLSRPRVVRAEGHPAQADGRPEGCGGRVWPAALREHTGLPDERVGPAGVVR